MTVINLNHVLKKQNLNKMMLLLNGKLRYDFHTGPFSCKLRGCSFQQCLMIFITQPTKEKRKTKEKPGIAYFTILLAQSHC